MENVWREIPGYEGFYEASSCLGKIRSVDRIVNNAKGGALKKGVILKEYIKDGYHYVHLQKQGKRKFLGVARLVAFTFPEICGEYFNGAEANHIDENKDNNAAENLNWLSHNDNVHYGTAISRKAESLTNNPQKCNKINQYTLDGKFVKQWVSAAEAQREEKHCAASIGLCCKGAQKKHHNFLWRYA